jgi:hypothetical protein
MGASSRNNISHCVSVALVIHLAKRMRRITSTGLFKMIIGVLTTCHTQYTSDSSIYIFYLIEQHSRFLLRTLQVLYMCGIAAGQL